MAAVTVSIVPRRFVVDTVASVALVQSGEDFMGLDGLTWVIMEAEKPHLIPGLVGDVDILAGNLEFKDFQDFIRALEQVRHQFPGMNEPTQQDLAAKIVTEDLGMRWPPESSRIIAIEVKCGYFSQKAGPQSEKSSARKIERLRQRLDLLLEMGFDKVALLDIIGNEPMVGPNAYMDAGWRAQQAARAFQPIIETRLTDDIPAAHFCWPVGSVFDRDEGKPKPATLSLKAKGSGTGPGQPGKNLITIVAAAPRTSRFEVRQ